MKAQEHFEKGQVFLKKRQLKEALDAFNKALEIEPENPFYLCERAVTYHHKKRNDLALLDMDHAVKIQPDYPYRYSSRAYVKAAMGDIEGGINDYKMAIKLDPNDAVAHNNLGLLQEQLGYLKSSKESFSKADNLSKDWKNLYQENQIEKHEVKDIESKTLNENTAESANTWSVFKNIFSSKRGFKEYIQFIKSGFKIED